MLDEARSSTTPALSGRTPLFHWGPFLAASGRKLNWKTECDALIRADWDCLAKIVAARLAPYSDALGVPTGGLKFAEALQRYRSPVVENAYIVCDDVWTTGASMTEFSERMFAGHPWRGIVAFARGPLPPHVKAIFLLGPEFLDGPWL